MGKLQALETRLQVAADTLQPQWRQCLTLVNAPTQKHYYGHPHDWTVGKRKGNDPVPLAVTYRERDPDFSFKHIDSSLIDESAWGAYDPRRVDSGPNYVCHDCRKSQSSDAERNECECFGDLFGPNARPPWPVQIVQTEDGRNNGVQACCSFDRGAPVGEFVGLVTKGLENVDLMQGHGASGEMYQIFQGRYGNFTRFINHSCQPNCQFQKFVWLGVQRIIVVSKGVTAGKEITVNYSDRYWQHLDKECLCGEVCCRYRGRGGGLSHGHA